MSGTTNTGSIASFAIGSDDFTLTNLGTIGTAASTAVGASGSGDTVVNAGTVRGATFGISASNGIGVTNSGAGAVIYGGANGVYVAGAAGSILNTASIGGGTYGIELKAGGTVTNALGGTVTGGATAIFLKAPGTIVNFGGVAAGDVGVQLRSDDVLTNQSSGTITGAAAVSDYGGSTVVNYGSIISNTVAAFHQGVDLGQNSLLTNQSSGLITGYFGVAVDGAATVVNYGTIGGGEKGVQLFEGGTLTNQSGGTIEANVWGVWATGPATVVNAGSITGDEQGVYLSQGYLTNQTAGIISNGVRMSGDATLLNAGTITGSTGAYLTSDSVLTNQSGGTISGSTGAEVSSYVVPGGGTIVNAASIAGSDLGVELLLSGTLVNQASGTISGGAGPGVEISGAADTYTNSYGVTYILGYRAGQGAVTNAGLISGTYGVQVSHSFATVTDSGTIAGSTDAIVFAPGYADRLVLEPGASIVGGVLGNGGALELASAASAGTLNSLGSQFAGFGQVIVDAGAYWVLNGTDTVTAGSTLTNAGTLDGSNGVAVLFAPGAGNRVVADPGALFIGTVDGGNAIGSGTPSVLELAAGTVAGSSTLSGLASQFIDFAQIVVDPGAYWAFNPDLIPSGVTLTNAGTIGGSVVFDPGPGNRVVDDPTGVFLGSLDGGNPVGGADPSTLELASGGSTGTLSGLGTQITDFSQITVDPGASWYLTNDTFAAGMTVTNAGTLSGSGGTAVAFSPGAGNRVVIDQGGTFSGTVDGGNPIGSSTPSVLELAGGSGFVALSGIGTQFTNFSQITVDAGAYWSLTGSNTIAPGATLTVSGELANTGLLNGNVTLAGGTILNDVGGTITGAISAAPAAAEVSNAGTIDGAVSLAAGFSNVVVLYPDAVFGGTVSGGGSSSELQLGASGPTVGTLTGFGTQYTGFGEIQVNPSAYWNVAGNIFAAGTTLINAGTVEGSPDAARFAAGAGNRVVIAQGGTFSGIVDGGNTLGSATPSVLELTSRLSGGGFGSGTISGLGTQFINFASIAVDSGADWGVTGSNTIAANATLTVYGYLGNYGTLGGTVTLADSGELRNNSLVNGAVIGTGTGVVLKNFGTVLPTGTAAVSFSNGGSVYNDGGISGARYGVQISGGFGVVNNQARIGGTTAGIAILAGGSIYNAGTITGAAGVVLGPGGGTVVNYSQITGTGSGVLLQAGGTVLNRGGTISGLIGVQQTGPGAVTVANLGTISGSGGNDSVLLHAGAANRVVVYQGDVFNGVVDGGNPIGGSAVSTLELASSSTPGVLSGLGSQYIDFAQITADPGAQWSLGGSNTIVSGATLSLDDTTLTDTGTLVNNGVITLDPSDLTVAALTGTGSVTITAGSTLEVQGTISGGETIVFAGTNASLTLNDAAGAAGSIAHFAAGDYIDLTNIPHTNTDQANLLPGNTLEVVTNSGTLDLHLAPTDNFSGDYFHPNTDGATGSLITEDTTPCYCRGTAILTDRGEVPVEALAIGDRVLTPWGEARPIKWIGHRAYRGRFIAGNRTVQPILIRAGALDDNVPQRDLYVSPLHAMFLDNVLVPAEKLVNGVSILRCESMETVEYFHVELDQHDIMLAEGAPAESFVDCDNRFMFHNAAEFAARYPDDDGVAWAFCAPRIEDGEELAWIRARLEERLAWFDATTTLDPDLVLLADANAVAAEAVHGCVYRFRLARPPAALRIVSRSSIPAEVEVASTDVRRLGVNLLRMTLSSETVSLTVGHADSSLVDGFHAAETTHRWTDGDARVPAKFLACFDGELTVEVELLDRALAYRSDARPAQASVGRSAA
jgi:hypothetical protein